MNTNKYIENKNEKQAIMIIAHKNFSQLCRLVNKLTFEYFDIFIHLDKKFELNYEQITYLEKLNNGRVYLTKKRHDVNLFSFRQIEATLELINLSMSKNIHYRYYILISGQDYPLHDSAYIYEHLNNNYPKPFIDVDKLEENNWVYNSFRLNYSFKDALSKADSIQKKCKNKYIRFSLRILMNGPIKLATYVATIYKGAPSEQLDKINIKPFGGAQWWILPDDIIYEIAIKGKDINFLNIMKHVFSPDETFFQTILMNSKYSSRVANKKKSLKHQNILTYADFRDEKGNAYGHPKIFTMKDFEFLNGLKGYLFARKFDEKVDSLIMDKIDESNLLIR